MAHKLGYNFTVFILKTKLLKGPIRSLGLLRDIAPINALLSCRLIDPILVVIASLYWATGFWDFLFCQHKPLCEFEYQKIMYILLSFQSSWVLFLQHLYNIPFLFIVRVLQRVQNILFQRWRVFFIFSLTGSFFACFLRDYKRIDLLLPV